MELLYKQISYLKMCIIKTMEDELKVTLNQTFDDLLLMDDTAFCSCWFKYSVVMYCEDSSRTFLPLSTFEY